MQTRALELAGDMFSILVERCNILVAAGDPAEILMPDSLHQEELTPLLAAVKVWCDWLIGNNDTWYPVVSAEPFSQIAQLATRLEVLKPTVCSLLESCLSDEAWRALPQARREEFNLIKLTEDSLLCDFEPWFRGLDWATYRQFYPRDAGIAATRIENGKRIDQIRMCVEVLEGLEPPVLKWSVLDRSHVCLVSDRDESTQESVARDIAEAKLTALIARDEDILEESYSGDEEEEKKRSDSSSHTSDQRPAARLDSEDVGALSDELARLRLRKEELMKREESRQAQRDLLAQHVSTTLEVRPKIVVPDTNAFVDHLEDIKKIALSGTKSYKRLPVVILVNADLFMHFA
jgi:protein SMG6